MSKLYLVVRLTWFGYGFVDGQREPGGTPVAGFRRKTAASALCKRLQREAREEIASPFRLCDDLDMLTTLSEDQFVASIEKLRLTPPALVDPSRSSPYNRRDWIGWYDSVAPSLTARQRQGLWKLLDRVQCYDVLAVEMEEAAS
jgi:hypothetical protein